MKMIILTMVILFLSLQKGCILKAYEASDEPISYLYVDKLPTLKFKDGLKKFIYSNLEWPKKFDGEGKVIVYFVVSKTGKVKNVKIEKSLCLTCDEEVIRIINLMPEWSPGELNNKAVDVEILIPVYFKVKK